MMYTRVLQRAGVEGSVKYCGKPHNRFVVRLPRAMERALLRPRRLRLTLQHVAVRIMCLERARHGVALVMSDAAEQRDGLPGPQDARIWTGLGHDAVARKHDDPRRDRVATSELDGGALAVGGDRQDVGCHHTVLRTDHRAGIPGTGSAGRLRCSRGSLRCSRWSLRWRRGGGGGVLCGTDRDAPQEGGEGTAELTDHRFSFRGG